MKGFLVVASLFILTVWAGVPKEVEEINRRHHEECSKISHLDGETIKKMKSGIFDDTNPAVRDHIYCFTQKKGFINDNAELQKEVIKTKMNKQVNNGDLVEKIIEKCILPVEGDKKLWACKTLACYYKNAPGIVIL